MALECLITGCSNPREIYFATCNGCNHKKLKADPAAINAARTAGEYDPSQNPKNKTTNTTSTTTPTSTPKPEAIIITSKQIEEIAGGGYKIRIGFKTSKPKTRVELRRFTSPEAKVTTKDSCKDSLVYTDNAAKPGDTFKLFLESEDGDAEVEIAIPETAAIIEDVSCPHCKGKSICKNASTIGEKHSCASCIKAAESSDQFAIVACATCNGKGTVSVTKK